jgi:hypothetical protein
MLQRMSSTEYRHWKALAMIEAQIAELVRGGTEHDTAERMAWTRQGEDEED